MVDETPKKKAWGDDSDSDDSGAVSRMEDLKPVFVETKTHVADDDSVKIRVLNSPRNNRLPQASPRGGNLRSPMGSPKGSDRIRSPIGSPKSVGSRSANSSPDRDRRGRGGKSLLQMDPRRRGDSRDQFRGGGRGDHGTRERLPLGGGDVRGGDVRLADNMRQNGDARLMANDSRLAESSRAGRTSEPRAEDHRGSRNEIKGSLRIEHGTIGGERTPRGRDVKKVDETPAETPRSYQKLQLLPRSASNEQSLTPQASKLFGEAKPRELVLAARKEKDKSDDTPASPTSSVNGAVGEPPSLSPVSLVADESIPTNEPAVVRKFSGRGGRGRGNHMSIETSLGRSRGSALGEDEAPDSGRSLASNKGRGHIRSLSQRKERNDGSDTSRSVSRESRTHEGVDSARNSLVCSEDDKSVKKVGDASKGLISRGVQVSRESSRSASRGAGEHTTNDDESVRSASLSRGSTQEGIEGATLSRVKSSEELKRGTGRGIQSAGDVRSISSRGRGVGVVAEEGDLSRSRPKNWGRGGCTAVKVDVKEPKDKDAKDGAKSPLNRFEALAEDESDH